MSSFSAYRFYMKGMVAGILLAVLAAIPQAIAQTSDPAGLIAAAKRASGGDAWDSVTNWTEQGKILAGGLSGTYQSWLNLPKLQSAEAYQLGPISGSGGWDGKVSWTTDSTKQVRVETSGHAVAGAVQDTYRATYAFFFPDRWPAAITDAGERKADGVSFQAVKVVPKGAEPFEIWFDPTTHLVARELQLTGEQPHTFLFSGFRKLGGLTVPFHTIDRIGDAKFDQITDTGTIDVTAPIDASQFSPPPPPADDAVFPAGKVSVTVPFQLFNNHIYVLASINGKPPIPFVFDTGATAGFDTDHAKALGIEMQGALPGGGFGDKIATFGFAKVKSVSIGGLTLPDQVFFGEDSAGWMKIEGADSGGLLGYEFAKRAVLTIDYAHRQMTFTKPSAFHPPAGVTAIPFKFDAHIPMVEGTVDGIGGEFEIDTGSRASLTIMAPFAETHQLVAKYHATHLATTGYGVGGPSKSLLARIGVLEVGPATLKLPVTEFVADKRGAAAAERVAGNIGGDLLKRFTMTLDYGHQLLYLQPNALAAKPDVFDRAGLWIARAADQNILIADVSADSAASSLGLKIGDEIVAVNGKPTSKIALYDLRETFKKPVGTAFTLSIKDKFGAHPVKLVLAEQV